MKTVHDRINLALMLLQGQIYASSRLGAWCFNEEKDLYYSTALHQDAYRMLLQAGGCLDLALSKKDEEGCPYILNGELGLSWIAEWAHLPDSGRYMVLLGPVYLKNRSVDDSLHRLDKLGISQHLRQTYLNVLSDVPVLSFEALRQYGCILHYSLYLETMQPVLLQVETGEKRSSAEDPALNDSAGNDYARMNAYEEMLLSALREGREPEEPDNHYAGELHDFGLRDTMRQVKDNLIVFNALCARTAQRSGVPVATARQLESEWVRRIEALRGVGDAMVQREAMHGAYLRLVRRHRNSGGLSLAVRECMDYVQLNYMQPITLKDIARHCNYEEYYLSRKFNAETGMKLRDYIHRVRIDAAKVMLISSTQEIKKIGESLQFSDRNHFDKVFRELVGVSPARFREQSGRIE